VKIALVNSYDIIGGAARAAYRIHQALLRHGVDSTMHVNQAEVDDWTVQGPIGNWHKTRHRVRLNLGRNAKRPLKTGNPVIHSPALMPSLWPMRLNALAADIVHLHWINDEMFSIADIGRIRKPIVWTLHDMWAFCGAEHYTEEFRWREGYQRDNRPDYESGFDLNHWVWRRKRKKWRQPMQIVTPSRWLAECVRESALMRDWPVTVVPYALDTDVWRPIDKQQARELFGLPLDTPILLFGAIGGSRDPRKGFDLLQSALQHLNGEIPSLHLVVCGQSAPEEPPDFGFPVHYTGRLHDDFSLRVLYSAADALVIPSRQDNLPNTGVESLACGTPVVAFDTCGLPDIVQHQKTGYLARAFDTEELAKGIRWLLADRARHTELSANARHNAVTRFAFPAVAARYMEVYRTVLSQKPPYKTFPPSAASCQRSI